jgi:hypothetical protein
MTAGQGRRYFDKVVRPREPSIEIQDGWMSVHSVPLAELNKLKADPIPVVEEMYVFFPTFASNSHR